MIKHLVLLSFKENHEDKINEVFHGLKNLMNVIPEIKSFSTFNNVSKEAYAEQYKHGFVMEFHNDSDRDHYLNHPEHIALAKEVIFPLTKNPPIVFDYVAE